MIKSILIPTDGSQNSKVALEYGIYVASQFEAQISGINVVDIRSLEGPLLGDLSGALGFSPYQNYLPKFQEILEEKGNIILEGFKKACEEKSAKCKTKRLAGVISNIISDEGKKVDLIVMAQRGEHAEWSSGLLGSTTESVVRKSLRPVLVTPGYFSPFNNVLHPYDGSGGSNKALKLACELVHSLKLKLTVIVVSNNETKGEEIIAEAREFITPYNVNADVVRAKGETGEEILKYAESNNIDLIVMGAFGHSRLHDLILGGTTAYVIRKSTLPILLER